ncbi:MAG: hypothetical protein ACH350_07475 [Parachlamydiaceae bacterium]
MKQISPNYLGDQQKIQPIANSKRLSSPIEPTISQTTDEVSRKMFEKNTEEENKALLTQYEFKLVRLETQITTNLTENKTSFFSGIFFSPKPKLEETKAFKEIEKQKKELKGVIENLKNSIESLKQKTETETGGGPKIEDSQTSKDLVDNSPPSSSSPRSITGIFYEEAFSLPAEQKANQTSLHTRVSGKPMDGHPQLIATMTQGRVEKTLEKFEKKQPKDIAETAHIERTKNEEIKEGNTIESLQKRLSNKVKSLTGLPFQNPSTESIRELLFELKGMSSQNDEERTEIDKTKLILINLLMEKALRKKTDAKKVIQQLIEERDPVMMQQRTYLINSQDFVKLIPAKLANLVVRSWGDKDILGARTEEKKKDGRHADAFNKFGELYKELSSNLLQLPILSKNEKELIQQIIEIYEELDKEHEQFVQNKAFANKITSKTTILFSPEELDKIKTYQTKIEELKQRIDMQTAGLHKFGNAGLAMEGYLSIPINGILRSLKKILPDSTQIEK